MLLRYRFGGLDEEIEELAQTQSTSVEEIVKLVKENEDILNLMRVSDMHHAKANLIRHEYLLFSVTKQESLRQRIIQDVVGIVLRADRDGSQKFDRVEAKILALKIKVSLEVYGMLFDEDKFVQAIALNPSLSGALTVVKKLLPIEYQEPNDSNDEHVRSCSSSRFDDESLDEDDIYDMFYMSREEQEQRGSVLAVRAQFDKATSRKISLASPSVEPRRLSALVRSRLVSSDDVILGEGNMFSVKEEC
jgi:hypothetical protein